MDFSPGSREAVGESWTGVPSVECLSGSSLPAPIFTHLPSSLASLTCFSYRFSSRKPSPFSSPSVCATFLGAGEGEGAGWGRLTQIEEEEKGEGFLDVLLKKEEAERRSRKEDGRKGSSEEET